ncbi:MAG: hypothetical protein LBU95_06205 [Rikenellaceae bacterium]|jgi:hypothetical protein|nr:hypothetical protein [Rikenellaceae bacterium]
MEGVLRYLMQNYHIPGVLVIVTIIAIKLFMTTRHAKKAILNSDTAGRLDDIKARLERIEELLGEKL